MKKKSSNSGSTFVANDANLDQASLIKWVFMERILRGKLTALDMPNSWVSGIRGIASVRRCSRAETSSDL